MKECSAMKVLISMYIDNELNTMEKIQIERHLEECKECNNDYLDYIKLSDIIHETKEDELPEGFSRGLNEKLLKESKSIKKEMKVLKWKRISNFAYSVAAIFIIAIFAKWGFDYYGGSRDGIMENTLGQNGALTAEDAGKASKVDGFGATADSISQDNNIQPIIAPSSELTRGDNNDNSNKQIDTNSNRKLGSDKQTQSSNSVNNNVAASQKQGNQTPMPKKQITQTAPARIPNTKAPITLPPIVQTSPRIEAKMDSETGVENSFEKKSIMSTTSTVEDDSGKGNMGNSETKPSSIAIESSSIMPNSVENQKNIMIDISNSANNKKEAVEKVIKILDNSKVKFTREDDSSDENNPVTYFIFKVNYSLYKIIYNNILKLNYATNPENEDVYQGGEFKVVISVS